MKTLTQLYGRVVGVVRPDGLTGIKYPVREKNGAYWCPCAAWGKKKVCRHTRKVAKQRWLRAEKQLKEVLNQQKALSALAEFKESAKTDWALPPGFEQKLIQKLVGIPNAEFRRAATQPKPSIPFIQEAADIFSRIREEKILTTEIVGYWVEVLQRLFGRETPVNTIEWKLDEEYSSGKVEEAVRKYFREREGKEDPKRVGPVIRKYNLNNEE